MSARRDVTIWCDGVRNDGWHTDDHAPGCERHGPQGDTATDARSRGNGGWGWITAPGGRDYSRECARERGLIPRPVQPDTEQR